MTAPITWRRRLLAIDPPDRVTLAAWRVAVAIAVAATVVLTHWPPHWLSAIPVFAIEIAIWRQAGGYALLTIMTALARPLGGNRPWHLQVAAAAVILTACVYLQQWTVPLIDPGGSPADASRKCLGIIIALGVGMAASPAAHHATAAAWFWRTVLIMLTPPCLLAAFLPGFDRQLMFLVPVLPGWEIRADHMGHCIGAFIVTMCLMQARLCGLTRSGRGMIVGAMCMVLAGPMLELVQELVGRGQEFADVVAHELGVAIAGVVAWTVTSVSRGRSQPHSGTSRLAHALRRMRGRMASIVALAAVLGLIDAALFVPLGALILRFFLMQWGRASVGNFELAAYLFTPGGLASLLALGGLAITLIHLEVGGMALLLLGAKRRSWHVIWALRRRVVTLVKLSVIQAAVLLLTSLPFLVLLWAIYRTAWAGYDLNGILVLKPPAFWVGAGLGGAVAGAYAFVAITLLLRWSLSPVMAVLEPIDGAWTVLRRSAALTQGRRQAIARAVGLCLLMTTAIGAVILGGIHLASDALLDRLDASLTVVLAVTAVVLTLSGAVAVAIAAWGRAALAGVVLGFYEECVPVTTIEPQAATPLGARSAILAGCAGAAVISGWVGYGMIAGLKLHDQVEITAHRGGAWVAPENTVAAIRRAIADGAQWAEIDVQLTADGQIVVIHDTDLIRVGGVRRWVAAMSLAQIQAVDVGSRFSPAFAGERVPTLDQVIAAAGDHIHLNIELKPAKTKDVEPLTHAVIQTVIRTGIADRCRICSQSYAGLMLVRQLAPNIPVGFIAGKALGDLAKLDVDFLMVRRSMVTRRLVNRGAGRGIAVHAWTINDPRDLAALIDQGVANVITDDPAAMRVRLNEIRELTVPQRLLLRARNMIAD